MNANKFYSRIFRFLVKTDRIRFSKPLLNRYWNKLWNWSTRRHSGAIGIKIHGYDTVVNNGYMYPIFSRRFDTYNNPLVQLIYQMYRVSNRKINIVDVGAAIGDTIFLILKNCPDMIADFYCIEGEEHFYEYLQENLGKFPNAHLINALLSDIDGSEINELKHTHLGTASSIGTQKVKTITLDTALLEKNHNSIDVIKIDVDGLDGLILKGGINTIKKYKPSIIFEWHPIMISRTQNSFEQPFELLTSLGYTKFLWFTKYGKFSHFELNNSSLNRKTWVDICMRNLHDNDFHFDIIAIHSDIDVDILELAELRYAKHKVSTY